MGDFAATAEVVLTALGRRLRLWDALVAGAAPAEAVAERAGAALPYVREWLRSQAAAGYVSYDPAAEKFGLAPGVAAVLCDGPLAGLADGMAAQFAVWWAQMDRYEWAIRSVRCGAPVTCWPMTEWCCWPSTPGPASWKRTCIRRGGSSMRPRHWCVSPMRCPARSPRRPLARSRRTVAGAGRERCGVLPGAPRCAPRAADPRPYLYRSVTVSVRCKGSAAGGALVLGCLNRLPCPC